MMDERIDARQVKMHFPQFSFSMKASPAHSWQLRPHPPHAGIISYPERYRTYQSVSTSPLHNPSLRIDQTQDPPLKLAYLRRR